MSTLIFFLLWSLRKRSFQDGWLFALWLALAGLERFIVEFFRAKDDRFFGMLTLAQIISLILLAVGAYWVMRLRSRAEAPAQTAPA